MYKNRLTLVAIIVGVLASLLILDQFSGGTQERDQVHITLMTEAKYGEDWERVIAGATQAANEYGAELRILAPDYARTYEEQLKLFDTAVKGTDGIIIAPIDPKNTVEVVTNTVEAGIPVLSIVTDMDGLVDYIGSNPYGSGADLGALIVKEHGSVGKVVILSTYTSDGSNALREQGLRDYLEAYPDLRIEATYFSADDIYYANNLARTLMMTESPDVIVGLNLTMTQGAAEAAVDEMVEVYGFDMSESVMNLMDRNVIKGVVVQNYFAIGYLSVQNMIGAIERNKDMVSIEIDAYVVTPDSLYDKKSQMILFPVK